MKRHLSNHLWHGWESIGQAELYCVLQLNEFHSPVVTRGQVKGLMDFPQDASLDLQL